MQSNRIERGLVAPMTLIKTLSMITNTFALSFVDKDDQYVESSISK